jgi:hypothetical protein
MPLTGRELDLFVQAREYIASGRLPSTVPKSLGAGPGTGATCGLCGQPIEPNQVEYELKGDGGERFRFHLQCHAIWQLAAVDQMSGSWVL